MLSVRPTAAAMTACCLLLRAAAFRQAPVLRPACPAATTTTTTNRRPNHHPRRTSTTTTRLLCSSLPRSPAAVIFDMDGTLIDHSIDFAALRSRIWEVVDADEVGRTFTERECVLEVAGKLSPEGQKKCKVVFDDIERKAVDEMTLAAGGPELIRYLSKRDIKRAVLTRNLERNVEVMAGMYSDAICDVGGLFEGDDGDVFQAIVARDTQSDPSDPSSEPVRSKPAPDGILHLCRLWDVDPSEVVFVGDNANDDIVAANAAGCGGSVLVTPGGVERDTHSGYALGESEEEERLRTPSLRVESLGELMERMIEGAASGGGGDGGEGETRRTDDGTMVYEGGGFSVVVPSIGAKFV